MRTDWKGLFGFVVTWALAWGAAMAVVYAITELGASGITLYLTVPPLMVGLVVWYRYGVRSDDDGDGDSDE